MKAKKVILLIAMALCYLIVSIPILLAQELNLIYDKNGNLVTGDGYFREYNGFNQLSRIRNGTQTGQVLEEFTWHPIEERILIKDVYYKGIRNYTVYYVTPEYVVVENKTGNYTEKYVYQDNQLVAQVNTNGQKQFLHNDHEGTNSLVTDISGNVVENSFYSPFGEIINGGASSRYDYTGKEFDSVVGDYDYNARRYRADWGKFLQPDPIIQNAYIPQTLNHYAYTLNNPYKFIDTDGREVTLVAREKGNWNPLAVHSFLSITPDNPSDFGSEFQSFTLGGDNADGRLVILKDREADQKTFEQGVNSLKAEYRVPTPEGMTDTDFINEIINLWKDYKDNDEKVDFDLFPFNPENGANCNVASSSLLYGAGTSFDFFKSINPSGINWGMGGVNSVIASHGSSTLTLSQGGKYVEIKNGGKFGSLRCSGSCSVFAGTKKQRDTALASSKPKSNSNKK